jgi:hypothetical protein
MPSVKNKRKKGKKGVSKKMTKVKSGDFNQAQAKGPV